MPLLVSLGGLGLPVVVGLTALLLATAASATTTASAAAIYNYDRAAPNAQSALASAPSASLRIAAQNLTNMAQRSRGGQSGGFLAAKAGDDALRTVTALTREQDAALAAAMRDPNKLRHIFGKPEHNLGPLTRELGGQEALMREAVLAVPRGTTGTFEVTKRIGTYDLTVRGRVVDGVPRIGTVFVP